MGNFLDTPITEKDTQVDADESKKLQYGLSAMQGWRAQMEDDHVQILSMPEVPTPPAHASAPGACSAACGPVPLPRRLS
eukprot:5896804-Prymnesium_polylepis.1